MFDIISIGDPEVRTYTKDTDITMDALQHPQYFPQVTQTAEHPRAFGEP